MWYLKFAARRIAERSAFSRPEAQRTLLKKAPDLGLFLCIFTTQDKEKTSEDKKLNHRGTENTEESYIFVRKIRGHLRPDFYAFNTRFFTLCSLCLCGFACSF